VCLLRSTNYIFKYNSGFFFEGLKDRQYMYNLIFKRASASIVAGEKKKLLHIMSLCLLPLVSGIQSACAILPPVACPAINIATCGLSSYKYCHLWPV
jgi:uncharacterized membrane protein